MYSLIGLFGVNMPTIYGEGRDASIRLQLEIIRISNDHPIFAWEGEGEEYGMLATSPRKFANSAGHLPMEYIYPTDLFGAKMPVGGQKPDYSMTNFGLQIQLPIASTLKHFKDVRFAFLACTHGEEGEEVLICLPARTTGSTSRPLRPHAI